jgi:MerR family mercuric resistance operon transcriptional regulator
MRTGNLSSTKCLSIGELARLGGCRVDTIRYYERVGLLPKAERSDGGQRRYSEAQARQLLFIRRLRDLGFSLNEIEGFLGMVRRQSYGCAEFKTMAEARTAEIRRKIAELRRLGRRLAEMSAHCKDPAVATCGVIEALWVADIRELERQPRGTVCCGPT